MAEKINPEYNLKAFNCPNCGAFAKQFWGYAKLYELSLRNINRDSYLSELDRFSMARCEHCGEISIWDETKMIFPLVTNRDFDLTYVPKHLAEDYTEACTIIPFSPKASAALSRRCLQTILREQGFSDKSLFKEIQNAIDSKTLPSHIIESIDAVRNIGNFAAHPQKDINSGEIVPVEIGESEWNLDVLEYLFDFYYLQPEKARQRKEAFNKKLIAAGKPEMK
jgi:predicted RNA-binding Zn-ribbon protein involved in translation (DUF1610 family)